ncbi:urea transporter [Candidatus Peregrinibacteria bacterium]|nr:urea transporter [Candidatus Peregrinibacteria bacterium]
MRDSVQIILRGVGQVMLQNNALTGLLFLVGIFYNSWILGLGAILGNIVGSIFAVFLKYPQEDIKNGLYGFNGTLVGIAIWFFFGVNVATALAIIISSALSSVIMHAIQKRIPAFTAPFVLSTWMGIFGIKFLHASPLLISALPQTALLDLFSAISIGIGQVMFQENAITGLLFLFGILINSRTAAFYALYASLLGNLLAIFFHLPLSLINIGLFGYNAILCGIVLGTKKWDSFVITNFAIILSVLFFLGLNKLGIIALTAPFVLATWMVLSIKHVRANHTPAHVAKC